MRITRWVCAASAAGMLLGAQTASAQDTPQALRQEIDQLRRDFDALKQQYGDRLTALESKLAAAEGQQPAPAAATQPSPKKKPCVARCRTRWFSPSVLNADSVAFAPVNTIAESSGAELPAPS